MIASIIECAVSHCCLTCIGFPLTLFLLYQLYQALWARPRITRLPKDCYILITGCGRGFGREAAIRLDRLGCHVFAGCRSERGLKELDDVTTKRCRVFQMDVTDVESIKSAYELVRAAIPKGQGLWGLVNNAGIAGSSTGLPEWTKPSDYEECMKVNVYGIVDVTRTFLPLVKACQGRILMVSSMYGRISYPVAMPYAVSKYATEAISDGLRRSLRPYGCKVILIEPGVHRTNITSEENLSVALKKGWEDLSQDERDEYGENYLDEFTKYVMKFFQFPNFNSVTTVAEVIESALFCQYPKARYPVGNDSKWVFVPMTYMPEWLVDWLIDTVMRPPIPAVVLRQKKKSQ